MHLPTLLPLITATAALGSSSPAPVNNTRIAVTSLVSALMGSADIDLDELGSEGLAKRKAMTYCANRQSTPGDCKPLNDYLSGTLATFLKRNADANNCGASSGSVDGVAYKFDTAPDGSCGTTAEESTIKGGLNRYFDYLGHQICGVHCVRLQHGGGTYRAYITLGPEGSDLNSVSCSPDAIYTDCGNGGDNDA